MSSVLSKLINLAGNITGKLAVVHGGTGVTTSTGTGSVVLNTSPTLVTPALGTPSSGVLSGCSGYPIAVPGTSSGSISASGVPGSMTGTAISSTFVGEILITNAGSPVTISVNTYQQVVSVSVPKGTWDIWGVVEGGVSSTTSGGGVIIAVSTSGSSPDNFSYTTSLPGVFPTTALGLRVQTPIRSVTLSGATTFFLLANLMAVSVSGGTWTTSSFIQYSRRA